MAASSSWDTFPAATDAAAAAAAADAAKPADAAYSYPQYRPEHCEPQYVETPPLISNWQPGAEAPAQPPWHRGGKCATCGKEYYEWRWGLKRCEQCEKARGYLRSYVIKDKKPTAGETAGEGAAGGQESTDASRATVAAAAAAAPKAAAAAAAAAPTAAATSKAKECAGQKGCGRGAKGKWQQQKNWWS